MLCYVTPKEHLALPNEEDVERGWWPCQDLRPAANWRKAIRARNPRQRYVQSALNSAGKAGSTGAGPVHRAYHDETLPQEWVRWRTSAPCAGQILCR
ncbi:phosphomethylpyrimidine synthase ThiC [Shigella flexneri]